MAEDLEFRIAKLELKTGDILVAKFDQLLSAEQTEYINAGFKRVLPNGARWIILERGDDLAVLSFEEIERRTKLSNFA